MIFRYKVKDENGNIFIETIYKNNLKEVAQYLKENKLTVIENLNDYHLGKLKDLK